MARKATRKKQPKAIASAQSLSAFVKAICDIMRRSNCASALQYVPEGRIVTEALGRLATLLAAE